MNEKRKILNDRAKGLLRWPLLIVSLGMGGFHLYTAYHVPFPPLIQRAVHVLFALVIGFMVYPFLGKHRDSKLILVTDLVRAALVAIALTYLVVRYYDILMRPAEPLLIEVILGTVLLILLLELGIRTLGWPFPILCLLAISYALLGPYMPSEVLAHRGLSYSYFIYYLYQTPEGILGIPISVSARFVYLFILFGGLLFTTGAGKFIIDFANTAAGRTRGGPAKVAILSSALFGSISGSSVANVVTTGSFTIPLMKYIGYPPFYAAAVEAVASTGGQIMPPVMGAVGFLMSEITGIPYADIIIAAAIPAILYYVAVFIMVHLRAEKLELGVMTKEQIPRVRDVFKGGWPYLLPLAILIYFLVILRASPMRSALWAIAAVVPSALLASALTRVPLLKSCSLLIEGISKAAQVAVSVVTACGLAGIVIASLNVTGLSSKFTATLLYLAGDSLPILLGLTALCSFILGIGVSAVVAYILPAVLMAPALMEMGVPLIVAHMFVFYWAIIAHITPPVALAAYAAAGIAEADPMKTAYTATRLAVAGFILPMMFVYVPSLLMIGTAATITLSVITALLGISFLAMALEGWLKGPLYIWQRVLFVIAAIGLIKPGLVTDSAGIAIFLLCFLVQRRRSLKGKFQYTTT